MALPPADQLPNLLKHMVVAIYKRQKGSPKKKFMAALTIARARLTDLGYATPPSREGDLGLFRLTSSGQRKNMEHRNDSQWRQKNQLFASLYTEFRTSLEVQEMPEQDKITSSSS